MIIPRSIKAKIIEMNDEFPIVSITGPRQSGKSTLLVSSFPDYRYVSLEDPDARAFATEDPRSFLQEYSGRTIIDEAQNVPELFSYLQGVVDAKGGAGQYILSGSHNFLLLERISQSLAGRVALLKLLPFSYHELSSSHKAPKSCEEWLYQGGYPRLYDIDIDPLDYYPNYLETYLDRDVRSLSGITKLAGFNRFLRLCANRTGEILNISALANACDINVRTAGNWLSALEASYIVFRLQPYHKNLGKRLVKTPKLYFYDTGLVCSLLGIEEPGQLVFHEKRGALYENAVIGELIKQYFAQGRRPQLSYWRDGNKREIDLLVSKGDAIRRAIEIKSSATFRSSSFSSLCKLAPLLGLTIEDLVVVNAADQTFSTKNGLVTCLSDVHLLVD